MLTYRIGGRLAEVSRTTALALVAGVYLVAGAVGWLMWRLADGRHPIAVALAADVVATVVVFAGSMLVHNASVYDPYWSVAPPVIVLAWVATSTDGVTARQVVVAVLVLAWALRLTGHWANGWRGLGHEDWRYVQLREQTHGRLPWWLVNLAGIQLMPTLVVFAGLLALWPAVSGDRPLGPLDAVAVLVTGGAIGVEAVADAQLRRFRRDPANQDRVADRGLWQRSRHPNYLGEIAFWWGLWLFGVAAAPGWWWTVVGPLLMVVLFLGASIPMMDRRSLARRGPAYQAYLRSVPALLPRLRRHPSGAAGPGHSSR
jgi:steroid 5-alpha reductase family enzyme